MTQQIYKVTQIHNNPTDEPRIRLIKAEKRRHVEGLILQDFEITKASVEDGHALAGVEIEQAE